MNKLRTGDEVIIISGKDKGKTGTLTKFISKDKCIVMGLKLVKKHQKPNPPKTLPKSAALLAAPGVLEPTAFYACINILLFLA